MKVVQRKTPPTNIVGISDVNDTKIYLFIDANEGNLYFVTREGVDGYAAVSLHSAKARWASADSLYALIDKLLEDDDNDIYEFDKIEEFIAYVNALM